MSKMNHLMFLKTFHRRGNETLDMCTIKLLFISRKMLKVVRDAHGSERKIHYMTKAKLNVIFYIQKGDAKSFSLVQWSEWRRNEFG